MLRRWRREPVTVRRFAGPIQHAGMLTRPLRVVHLTDMHFGWVTSERMQIEAVRKANDAQPDLVVLTGDFVCHGQKYLDQLSDVLGRIDAPTFGVLGNHDHWSGAGEVRSALGRAGVEVLDNANTTITLRHQRLQLVGLDDAYTGHADRARAVKGLRRDLPTLGLSHIAEEADGLWAAGVPLVLSGHTHAGHVTLARLHEIAIGHIAGHKYVHGLYGSRRPGPRTPRGSVYVGAGIGASVMPLRLGERARRELTIFELGLCPGAINEPYVEQAPMPGRPPTPEQTAKRHAKVAVKRARRERRSRK